MGLAVGYFKRPTDTATPTPVENTQDINAKNKLQALTDEQITEYYTLKNDTERLKKADEILAKMMTIFLHDLGLRISRQMQEDSTAALSRTPEPQNYKAAETAPPPQASPPPEVAKTNLNTLRKIESTRHDIINESDKANFLEQTKIQNFDDALKSAKSYSNRTGTLVALQGQFLGIATVTIAKKIRAWGVDLFLDGNVNGNNFNGTAHIKISENGKVFSNSRDRGSLRSFKELNNSDALLIRASPTVYFQMYLLKGHDSMIGNVYQRNTEDEPYQRIGTVQLNRQ